MTFQDYVSHQDVSVRAFNAIMRYRITETTPYEQICQCRGAGRHSIAEIEQLQTDFIKTHDVAYQIVLESMRGGK